MTDIDIHFFTHADNQPTEAVVRQHPALTEGQHHQNAETLERVFTTSDFYRGFDNRTLKAVSRGFELEPDFSHHDGSERLSVDYLSERIEIIRQILDDRDGAEPDIKYIDRKRAKPVRQWKGGNRG